MSMLLSCLLPFTGPYKFAMRPLGATMIEIAMHVIFYDNYTKLFVYARSTYSTQCSINRTPTIVNRGTFIINHISKMLKLLLQQSVLLKCS